MNLIVSKEVNKRLYTDTILGVGNRQNFAPYYTGVSFDSLWVIAEPELIRQQETLQEDYLRVEGSLISAESDLNLLFATNKKLSVLEVYLRYSPDPNFQGGEKISANKIGVEKGTLKSAKDLNQFWLLMLHESIHAMFIGDDFRKYLVDYVTDKQSNILTERYGKRALLEELLVGSFAAGGYLAESYFGISEMKNYEQVWLDFESGRLSNHRLANANSVDLITMRTLARYRMFEMIKSYVARKMKIDDVFLDEIWAVVELCGDV